MTPLEIGLTMKPDGPTCTFLALGFSFEMAAITLYHFDMSNPSSRQAFFYPKLPHTFITLAV